MNSYNQHEMDTRFTDLIQQCRAQGLHNVASHFEKSQGMQRVHAVRFLEQMFETRQRNLQQRTRRYIAALSAALVLTALYFLVGGMS